MIRSTAFNIYFYTLTVLAALLGIAMVPIPGPVLLRGLLHRYSKAVVWGMRWVGGMKVEVRGREHLPRQGPALLACKHHAEVDGILLAAEIPGIAFVAMQELFKLPVIGAVLYRLQMIRVDSCGGGKEREHLAQRRRHPTGEEVQRRIVEADHRHAVRGFEPYQRHAPRPSFSSRRTRPCIARSG